MDDADRAQPHEEAERMEGLAAVLARRGLFERPQYMGFTRVCLDCLQPIPVLRLQAEPGAVRCAECQGRRETEEARR